jgi:hypothetical protein
MGAACAHGRSNWHTPGGADGDRRHEDASLAGSLRTPHPVTVPPGLRFYVYEEPALDQSWLAECEGFNELKESAEGEGMQEANLYRVLKSHPYRTWNASEAATFYVPIWEYSSFRLGNCSGTTHLTRMRLAATRLRASPFFLRSFGRDHFWATRWRWRFPTCRSARTACPSAT